MWKDAMTSPRAFDPAVHESGQVVAVVVSRGATDFLPETLSALVDQTRAPDRVVVVDVGRPDDPDVTAVELTRHIHVVRAPGARTFGAAVRAAIATGEPGFDIGWLWLLHDDSAPEPEALTQLLRAVEVAPSVAVAGCKQVRWDAPDQLLEVGVSTSRFGRRMTGLDDAEVDQGQHDGREDVLAVGLAGALVRSDVWADLGGPDPALGPYGDGLDLCRRTRLAGHRVVVVPRAVVRHAQASLAGSAVRPGWDERRSFEARREAFVHSQLVGVPALMVPLVAVAAVIAGLARALMRITVKEPHLIIDELLAPWAALARPGRVLAARRQAARTSKLRRSVLRPLQYSTQEVLRQYRDRRLALAEARRTTGAPSELERAELAAIRIRRRLALTALILVALALTVLSLGYQAREWFGGARLTGGTLTFGDADLGALWSAAGSWWVRADLGHAGPPDPFLGVLLPGTALLGTAGNAATAIVVGGLLAAVLGAWFAAGAVTRSVWLRLWVAVAWAAAPALLAGITQVRLGAVLAHAALPWAFLGVARALGVARIDAVRSGLVGAQRVSQTPPESDVALADPELAAESVKDVPDLAEPSVAAAAGAGLALCLVTVGAPALLPAALVGLGAVAVLRPRRRLWWVALPPLAVHGPVIAEVIADPGQWRALLASPGVPLVSTAIEPWQEFLGAPIATAGPVPGWLAGGALAFVALLSLFARAPQVFAVWLGWFLAALGLGTAIAIGVVPVTEADGAITAGWAGSAVSLITAGLLTAALVGAGQLRGHLSRRAFGWQHLGTALVVVVVVGAPIATLTQWIIDVHDDPVGLHGSGSVVPAVGTQIQQSDSDARVLALGVSDGVVRPTLLTGNGEQLTEFSRWVTGSRLTGSFDDPTVPEVDPATQELVEVTAALAVGSGEPIAGLVQLAVGAVLVAPPSDGTDLGDYTRLVAALDSTLGLERVTQTDAGIIWRVRADTSDTVDGTVAWARLEHSSTEDFGTFIEVVPAADGRIDASLDEGAPDRILVLAERSDSGWHASLDGVPLRAVETGWRQAFEIGPDGGHLVVSYAPVARTTWLFVQVPVLLAAVLLAVPVRRRRGR